MKNILKSKILGVINAEEIILGKGIVIYPMCNIDQGVILKDGTLLNNSVTVSHDSPPLLVRVVIWAETSLTIWSHSLLGNLQVKKQTSDGAQRKAARLVK